jgi:hypothetical protein
MARSVQIDLQRARGCSGRNRRPQPLSRQRRRRGVRTTDPGSRLQDSVFGRVRQFQATKTELPPYLQSLVLAPIGGHAQSLELIDK